MQIYRIKRDFGELTYYFISKNEHAPFLLCLSGLGSSHYNYLDLLPELSKEFQVILIDNRGIGLSDKTNSPYSIKDIASDTLAVMDQLKVKKFSVIGLSMGGFVAQELFQLAPERILSLVLMCTLSSDHDFISPVKLTEEGLRQFNRADLKLQAEVSTLTSVHSTLIEKNPSQYLRIVNLKIEFKADIDELVRQNNAAVEFLNSSFNLSIINCPTLALSGANDRFVNPENSKVFTTKIKNSRAVFISKADHLFFLEKPNEVADAIMTFFKEVL